MKRYIIIASMLLYTPTLAGAFTIDMTRKELNAAASIITVDDLAIGEIGLADPLFCIENDKLYIPSATRLMDSKSDYGANYRIRKEPGGAIRIDVFFGEKAKDKDVPNLLANKLASAGYSVLCKAIKIADENLVPIANINGTTSAKEAIGID